MSIINPQVLGEGCARDVVKRGSSDSAPYGLETLDTVLLLHLLINYLTALFPILLYLQYVKATSHDAEFASKTRVVHP